MFLGKRNSESATSRKILPTKPRRAVPYVTEGLECRRLLSASLAFGGTQDIVPGAMTDAARQTPTDTSHNDTWESEMTVAINPLNPLQIVGFSHSYVDEENADVELFRSSDGGVNWTARVIGNLDDNLIGANRFDPSALFDGAGRLFVAYGDDNNDSLHVTMSTDGGATFLKSWQIDVGGEVDKWHLATGPRVDDEGDEVGRAVYIAYSKITAHQVWVAGIDDVGIVGLGSATDWNRLWTRSNNAINNTASVQPLFAHPAVGPNGDLYVSWHYRGLGTIVIDREPNGLEGGLVVGTGGFGLDVVVRNLTHNLIDRETVPAQPVRGIRNAPTLAVDQTDGDYGGRLYLTFTDRDPLDQVLHNYDVFITVSDDGGATWTDPSNEDPSEEDETAMHIETTTHDTEFNPWVAVDQTSGLVGVAYYSSAADAPGVTGSAQYADAGYRIAASTNGGGAFVFDWLSVDENAAVQTSDESNGFDRDYLEYSGLALHAGTAHGMWSFRHDPPPATDTDLDPYANRASFTSSTGGNVLTVESANNAASTNDTIELRLSSPVNSAYLEVLVNNVVQYAGLLATLDTINVSPGAGNDKVILNFANGNLLAGVSVNVTGGSGTDTIEASADQNMTLTNTALTIGALGSATLATIEATILKGGAGANALDASAFTAGNVQLVGNAGHDTLTGGNGNDFLQGGDGDDRLWGMAGHDSIDGGNHADSIYGDDPNNESPAGNDTLRGGSGDDSCYGGAWNDEIWGELGADYLQGDDPSFGGTYAGSDILRGGDNTDVCRGGHGDDLIFGDAGTDDLGGEQGADTLEGGDGNDDLFGGDGNDQLKGNAGSDQLFGEDGDDVLIAADGTSDYLSGGNGNNDRAMRFPTNEILDGSQDYGLDLLTGVEVQ